MNEDDDKLQLPDNIDLQKHKDALKKNAKVMNQYIVALVACFGPTVGSVMNTYITATWPRIVEGRFTITATPVQISFLTSISPAFSIIGPLVNTYFINKIGRKYTICLFYVPYVIMAILLYVGKSYETFFTACCFGMVNCLFGVSIVSVYISEVSAPHLRGSLCALVAVCTSFGSIAGYATASRLNLEQSGLVFLIFCIIGVILSAINLEIPYFLLRNSNPEQARKNLKMLYNKEVVDDELSRLQKAVDASSDSRGWSMKIFHDKKYVMPLLLNINLLFIQSFSGSSTIWFNLPKFLREGCFRLITVEIAEIVVSLVPTCSQFLFFTLLHLVSRRLLYIFSVVSASLAVLSFAFYFLLRESNPWLANICDFFPFAILIWFSLSNELGMIPIPFLYFRELMPPDVVSISTFLLDVVQPIFTCMSVSISEFLQINTGSYACAFFFFFGCLMFNLVIFVKFTPDSQGKFLEEVELDSKQELPK